MALCPSKNGRRDRTDEVEDPCRHPGRERELATLRELATTFVPGDDGEHRASWSPTPSIARPTRARWGSSDSSCARWSRVSQMPRSVAARRRSRGWIAAAREAYLLGWGASRLAQRRTAFASLRKLLTFLAYADPGVGWRPQSASRRDRLPARVAAGHGYAHADRADRPALRDRRPFRADDPRRGHRGRRLGRRGRRRCCGGRCRGSLGRRPRGRPVRRRGVHAARRAGCFQPALPEPRSPRDLGRRGDDRWRARPWVVARS